MEQKLYKLNMEQVDRVNTWTNTTYGHRNPDVSKFVVTIYVPDSEHALTHSQDQMNIGSVCITLPSTLCKNTTNMFICSIKNTLTSAFYTIIPYH